jgi:hypothetical protein
MSATTTTTQATPVLHIKPESGKYPEPLEPSGALDAFEHFEVTPVIGREYPKVNLVNDVINAQNANELVRDLAITSMSTLMSVLCSESNLSKFLAEVWSSSGDRTTSLMNYTRN